MAINLKNITMYMFRTIYEREDTYNKFKPYFYRFIGVEDSSNYDNYIKTIQNKCLEEDKCIIFDGSIPLSGEMELIQYIFNELAFMDVYKMSSQEITIFKLISNCSNIYLPQQFSNNSNSYSHYYSTAPEIYNTLKRHHLTPSILVSGVGTGGTIMGIYKYLKEKNHHLKAYPLEPSSSPTLSTGTHTGTHRIQGISDEFVPPIVNLNDLNEIISIDDGDAIIMAQKLSRELGLGVGISSGANFIGAVKALELNSATSVAVTVFADDNKKYLSTDLMNKEPVKENYISSNIKLIDIKVL